MESGRACPRDRGHRGRCPRIRHLRGRRRGLGPTQRRRVPRGPRARRHPGPGPARHRRRDPRAPGHRRARHRRRSDVALRPSGPRHARNPQASKKMQTAAHQARSGESSLAMFCFIAVALVVMLLLFRSDLTTAQFFVAIGVVLVCALLAAVVGSRTRRFVYLPQPRSSSPASSRAIWPTRGRAATSASAAPLSPRQQEGRGRHLRRGRLRARVPGARHREWSRRRRRRSSRRRGAQARRDR